MNHSDLHLGIQARPTCFLFQDILLNEASVREGTVVENHNNALIAILTAADDDADDTHSFHLLNSADCKFRIEGKQLMVKYYSADFQTNYTKQVVVSQRPTVLYLPGSSHR